VHKFAIISCALVVVCSASAQQGLLEGPEGTEAITRPSKDVTLSFVRPGLVAEVLVADGDKVKAGEVLIRLDDRAEQVQLAQLEADAEDEIRIDAAKANLDLKTVQLEKVRKAARKGGATELEVREAEVGKRIQELTLKNEYFQREQNKRKYDGAKIQLERLKLLSPIDGWVDGVAIKVGEGAEAYKKVIRVVQIDPLWIDVPVPLARARERLSKGARARVAFTGLDGKVRYSTGTIIKISSVADAASDTLSVRVEVSNPSRRPAGEHVRVSFPSAVNAAGRGSSSQPGEKIPTKKEK